jgi:CheY-like chemotaxis protein
MATVHNLKPNPQTRRRVLVVEDNLDSVHSMVVLIKAMGHDCQFAINGFAALDAARKFRPDIVLLDIGLPDFEGDEIARQLKWEPGLENTRIIAITGLPIDDVGQRASDAGCEEIFAKPLDPAVLERLLAGPLAYTSACAG